jgi:DNA-binding response OmpR family regulator
MNVLVAVAEPGLRTLWEGVLSDHGHRPLAVSPDLSAWAETDALSRDLALVFELAIVELAPRYPESLELCRRLRALPVESRPSLMVLVQPADATDMIIALKSGADDVVLGHPDRRTAVVHLAAMERRHRPVRPALPTAGELASGVDLTGVPATGGTAQVVEADPIEPRAHDAMSMGEAMTALPDLACSVPATILLIDDEPTVRYPLRLALQHVGYRVIEAGDGEEGLEVIARRGDEIALVVVDQRMPRVSGLEVLRQVRRRPRRVPVVLMSGYPSLDPPDGQEGPDAFLRKPFELLDLARTVQRLMGGAVTPA